MSAYKIRRPKIRRVDLVDEGAAPDAHILIAKNKDKGYPEKKEGGQERNPQQRPAPSTPGMTSDKGGDPEIEQIRQRVREFLSRQQATADAGDNGMGAPMAEGGEDAPAEEPRKPRISHLSPEDFEVTSEGRNLIEWSLPEDKLPEGVEEVTIAQVRAGESMRFQWMMDPLNGPPMEGTGKTADEAFTALRAAITQLNGMDPNEGFGGLPTSGNTPGAGAPAEKKPANENLAKRIKLAKRVTSATVRKTSAGSAENTGDNSMPEIDLEALAESIPDEILDYIEELETENASLVAAAAAPVAKSDDSGDDVDLEKALSDVPESVREIYKAQAERLAAAEKALAEEQVAKANKEWVAKAAAFDGVIDNPDDFGPVLRKFAEVDADAAEKLSSALAAAASRLEKSALFSEMGHNVHIETDAEKQVEQLAKSLRDSNPEMTPEEARWQVFESNPALYDAHVAEHRARVKSA